MFENGPNDASPKLEQQPYTVPVSRETTLRLYFLRLKAMSQFSITV